MRIKVILLILFLLFGLVGTATAQSFSTIFVQPPNSTPIPGLADITGRLYVYADPSGAALATTLYTSAALEGSKVLSVVPAVLSGVVVTTSTTAVYLMVWNQTTVPADGAVTPALCFYIPSSPSSVAYALAFRGSVGISMAASTTGCYAKAVSATVTFMAWTAPL